MHKLLEMSFETAKAVPRLHKAERLAALWDSLGYSMGLSEDFDFGAPEPIPDVEPRMAAAYKNALSSLRSAGATIRPIDIAGTLAKLAGPPHIARILRLQSQP